MIWLVAVLILFQVVAALFLVGTLTLTGNVAEMLDIASLLTDRIDLVFIGNSIVQILLIGLATFFVVSWHTERKYTLSFLRVKWYTNTFIYILVGSLLYLAVQRL